MRVIQRAFALLQRSSLHFIGNVEPQDLFSDRTDAAICDGFVGNLLLKMYRRTARNHGAFFEGNVDDHDQSTRERLGQLVQRFQGSYDYQSVGGAPLLGVSKTVVVAHGRSQAKAMASAILLAMQLVNDRVYERLSAGLEKDGVLTDLKRDNTALMLEQLRSKWGFAQKQSSEVRAQKSDDKRES